MPKFAKVVAGILTKELARLPVPADDLNAGEKFVINANRDDARKNPGGDDQGQREIYEEKDELRNAVVPQHYVAEMGSVRLLYKAVGQGRADRLTKAKTLRDDITDREIVVGGYASPQVIDREKHLIEKDAMERDLPRFLANPLYANAMILHSNVQVGRVLPEWTHPETGEVYKTAVDGIGLFVVIALRTDAYRPKICDKVVEDIEAGNLKAFSISGDAPVESREHRCVDGACFWVIPEIEFYEITICEEGVNQDAKLMVLNKSCSDGMCGLVNRGSPGPTTKPPATAKPIAPKSQSLAQPPKPQATGSMQSPQGGRNVPLAKQAESPEELVTEHERVVDVLENPTPEKLADEAAIQSRELTEYREAAEEAGVPVETAEALRDKVEQVSENVGEEEAVQMVEDAADAAHKLDALKKFAGGSGVGTVGDASTMSDFAQQPVEEKAGPDPDVGRMVEEYASKLQAGGSPEQTYFFMLQQSPDWFGTRDTRFRDFLVAVYRQKLPIPTVRLRVAGREDGQVAGDPQFTAWGLLQTALGGGQAARMDGGMQKDVSPVEHEHVTPEKETPTPKVPHKKGERGAVDERGMREGPDWREQEEPEESEEWYLNLAINAINKGDSTLSAVAESKIHQAYTEAMDGLYRLGLLTREQRIALSSAITDGLDAFRAEVEKQGLDDLEIPAEDVALLMKDFSRIPKPVGVENPIPPASTHGGSRHSHAQRAKFLSSGLTHNHPEMAGGHHPDTHLEPPIKKHLMKALPLTRRPRRRLGEDKPLSRKEQAFRARLHETLTPTAPPDLSGPSHEPRMESKHKGPNIKPHPHGKRGYQTGGAAHSQQVRPRAVQRPGVAAFSPKRGDKVILNDANDPGIPGMPAFVLRDPDEHGQVRVAYSHPRQHYVVKTQVHISQLAPRQLDNAAVPIEIGRTNSARLISGGHQDAMEIVHEQVARSRFQHATLGILLKGLHGRDFRHDAAQQVEPENVAVMGGVRNHDEPNPDVARQIEQWVGKPDKGPPAVTEIAEPTGDTAPIGGRIAGEPIEQPTATGLTVAQGPHPEAGIRGEGKTPEYVVENDAQPAGVLTDNEGASKERDETDTRGAIAPQK